jgi:hypothetical protein
MIASDLLLSPEKECKENGALCGPESLFPTLTFSPTEELLLQKAEEVVWIEGTVTVSSF